MTKVVTKNTQFAAPAREMALEVLLRVERDGAFSHLALSGVLDRLSSLDRSLTTELVYGTLTWRLRIDWALSFFASLDKTPPVAKEALRLAAFQLLFLDKIPPSAACNDAVTQIKRSSGKRVAGFANAVLRKLVSEGERPLPTEKTAKTLSIRYSLPIWMIKRRLLTASYEEVEAQCMAEKQKPLLCFRVNTEKVSKQEVKQAFGPDVSLLDGTISPVALRVKGLENPFQSRPFLDGWITAQDEGAQIVSLALAPPKNALVLDACCGFGGKSLHLATLVGKEGKVIAIDNSAKKLKTLEKEAKRLQISQIETLCADLCSPPSPLQKFSYVLLDAPCSGLGTLRRHPELRWRRKKSDIQRAAKTQKELLANTAHYVANHGTLLYAVCSFDPEEGIEIIKDFLQNNSGFSIDPINEKTLALARTKEGFLKTSAHQHQADSFFIARLKKKD